MREELEKLSPPEFKAFCEGRFPQHAVREVHWRTEFGGYMITEIGHFNVKGPVTGEIWNDEVSCRLRGNHLAMIRGKATPKGNGFRTVYYERIVKILKNKNTTLVAE